ncbi:MAG: chlorite dismutase family protein, partial [Chloroflexota bacterium]|nr:chlorite dismutase family protein [Chloroflexota bacterium]
IRALAVQLRQSGLGRYLTSAYTYVGVTSAPRYDPEHQPAFAAGARPRKFASVYPFVKTAEWYLLSREERGQLMAEHGRVGRRYAVPRELLRAGAEGEGAVATAVRPETEVGGGVLSNTVDAFGLGDYEFILANESDDPSELAAMMMALRATEVRRYTRLDTPIFLGRLREPEAALAEL